MFKKLISTKIAMLILLSSSMSGKQSWASSSKDSQVLDQQCLSLPSAFLSNPLNNPVKNWQKNIKRIQEETELERKLRLRKGHTQDKRFERDTLYERNIVHPQETFFTDNTELGHSKSSSSEYYSRSVRKNINIFKAKTIYYSGYFLSSFVFDIGAVILLISLSPFLTYNALTVGIAFLVFSIGRVLFSALDAVFTERTKIHLKTKMKNEVNQAIKTSKLEPLKNKVRKTQSDDPQIQKTVLELISFLDGASKDIEETDILEFLDERENLSINQRASILNIANTDLLNGSNWQTKLSGLSTQEQFELVQTTLNTGSKTRVEQVLLLNLQLLLALKSNKADNFRSLVNHLFPHLDQRIDVWDEHNVYYRNQVKRTFSHLLAMDIEVALIIKHTHELFKDDQAVAQSQILVRTIQDVKFWPESMVRGLNALRKNGIHKKWIVSIYASRTKSSQELIALFKEQTSPRIRKHLIAPMVKAHDTEVNRFLTEYLLTLENPQNDPMIDSLARRILSELSFKKRRENERRLRTRNLLKHFLSKPRTNLDTTYQLALSLQEDLNKHGKITVFRPVKSYEYPQNPSKRLIQRQLWDFSVRYLLAVILFQGLIFYPLFANPLFSLSVSVIIVAVIFALGIVWLQYRKGKALNTSQLNSFKRAELWQNHSFQKALTSLENDSEFLKTSNPQIVEDKIYAAFQSGASQSFEKLTANDWRTFYIVALSKRPQDKSLIKALSGLSLDLSNKSSVFFDKHIHVARLLRRHWMSRNLPLEQKVHFFNVLSPEYLMSSESFLRKNGKPTSVNNFEIIFRHMFKDDKSTSMLKRTRFFHFLASAYMQDNISAEERARIITFLLRQLKYYYETNAKDYFLLQQSVAEILQDLFEHKDQNIWKAAIDSFLEYLKTKEQFNASGLSIIFEKLELDTQRVNYLLGQSQGYNEEGKKMILYLLAHNPKVQSQQKRLLPNIFYKRYGGYTVFFFTSLFLVVFSLYAIFATTLTISVTTTAFIVPLILLNLVSLGGRFSKDIMEEAFDKKHLYRNVSRYKTIDAEKLDYKEQYQAMQKAIEHFHQGKKTHRLSYSQKQDQLYELFEQVKATGQFKNAPTILSHRIASAA